MFILVLAFYNCFEIPFEIAYNPEFIQTPFIQTINNLTDLFFFLDILVSFRTTYADMETGDEVFSGKHAAIEYLKTRFIIDFVSTVPVDTIAEIITGESKPELKLFSLLKLVRVTRLGKMIAKMNVTQYVKNILKLLQLFFYVIMYLHCAGCLWYVVVAQDKKWVPALDLLRNDYSLYERSIAYQYWVSIYVAVL